ncbi:MAG TPA: hypothetical protein VE760_09125, partial [Acidimicrobiales bacterium]|nr:hypothetical protein [Acidimicrobiales bacterium]
GLLRDGDLHLPLTRFRLEELASAVESLANGETVGRVVLVPAPERRAPAVDRFVAAGEPPLSRRRAA